MADKNATLKILNSENSYDDIYPKTIASQVEGLKFTPYATCSTASTTVAKVAVCNEFKKLETGASVRVKFTNTNTALNPTLNVNNTGAKLIMRYENTKASNTISTSWASGSVITFVYDGTYWFMCDVHEHKITDVTNKTHSLDTTTSGSGSNLVTVNTLINMLGRTSAIEGPVDLNTYAARGIYVTTDEPNSSTELKKGSILIVYEE